MGNAGFKRCTGCRQVLPLSEFYFKNRAQSIRQNFCKSCKSRYNRHWYRRNRQKHIADVRDNARRYRARIRRVVREAKSRPCSDCGQRFPPVAMDFDHVEEGTKVADVSYLATHRTSVEAVQAEIAKCEVVCANCHRIRTTGRSRSRTTLQKGSGHDGGRSARSIPAQPSLPGLEAETS
jgi:hypothetical protein